ncbi:glucose sorbosone dehydrogenase [Leptolyngbya sp. Heron Island J]|uniref:PQQ-dependent sugar dehydrogenase n=1 Tax=Leptolyngbya sp. Heron Island J TaxID=1385935 RepID=UPI0003B96A74|nr:PQQ-dependent sugar dehydrogenase [Leptolyngbya sp. Heron Island J]ESA33585.1 glucose sorbosone dehydrogenase [Leptolyngbya sp. Heron Island J]
MLRYNLTALVGAVIAGSVLLGCATSDPGQTATTADAAPVTAAPDGTDSPEPESQTMAQVETLQQTILAESLEHPWGMAWLPDGNLIITERPGRVRLLRAGSVEPISISGVPSLFATGQGGLLDVSVHPQFADNQWVYFTYAHGSAGANQTRVARARLDGNGLSEWTVIFEVNREKQGSQHFGSRITWLPDNTMLVSIGDGGNPPIRLEGELIRHQAQKLDSHLGKVVRLNDDGSVPGDNPFVDTPGADPAVWSYGHRNIQGLMVDPVTGQVWATEHGSRGGDELNRVNPGDNYGWPLVTHSREYTGGEISSEQSRPGMVDPLVVWTPAIAPSGLLVYQGDRFPQWQGDLFAGGLVSQDVRHIELSDAGTVVNETPIPIGQRVRDVRQGPDGLIYILTDEPNGRLIRLEPG